jgi:Zn finger protein HypA/HybF involved in hydrogenase expression
MTKEEVKIRFDMIDELARNVRYEKAEIRRLQLEIKRAGVKYCPGCGRTKEDVEFGMNKSRPDGLAGYCKECRSGKKSLTKGAVLW